MPHDTPVPAADHPRLADAPSPATARALGWCLVGLIAFGTSCQAEPAPAPAAAAAPAKAAAPARVQAASEEDGESGDAEDDGENLIQKLVKNREFDKALLEIEQLRTAGTAGYADPKSELWAGHALSRMGNHDAARMQFLRVAERFPDDPSGREAAVEASAALIRALDGGTADTEEERAQALQAAHELEEVAKKYASVDPGTTARAYYIAGNALWVANRSQDAEQAWQRITSLPDDEYAAKALYRLATSASRDFKPDLARDLYSRCVTERAKAPYASRCAKNLDRLDVVGTPVTPIVAETWINAAPVDIGQYHGQVVLLWFFATWCPHCKQTMPEIADYSEKYKDRSFKVVGITSNTKGQTTADAVAFVNDPQWRITYPAAVDLAGRTSRAYGAESVPSAALIDKSGIIRWADHPVYLQASMIEKLLAE